MSESLEDDLLTANETIRRLDQLGARMLEAVGSMEVEVKQLREHQECDTMIIDWALHRIEQLRKQRDAARADIVNHCDTGLCKRCGGIRPDHTLAEWRYCEREDQANGKAQR